MRLRHHLRRHVRHQRHVHRRELGEPYPADGLVGRDVEIAGPVAQFDLGVVRRARVLFVGAVPDGVDVAVVPGVGNRSLRPRSRVHVPGGLAGTEQVHRHHGELQDRPALYEQHVEVLGRFEHFQRQTPRLLVDRVVFPRTVAHLDERETRALVVQEFVAHLFEHADGKRARPCTEVMLSLSVRHRLRSVQAARCAALMQLITLPSTNAAMTPATPSATASCACSVDAPMWCVP